MRFVAPMPSARAMSEGQWVASLIMKINLRKFQNRTTFSMTMRVMQLGWSMGNTTSWRE